MTDIIRWIITCAIALAAGFAGAAIYSASSLGDNRLRDYIIANPEILPEAMEVYQQRQMLARMEPLRNEIEAPFPGAVLGNPQGSITLVEFTDYACTYCRTSLADVQELIAENPDLKVVIREYPILSQYSVEAARMALAAAQQGKFEAFHNAMFAQSHISPESIQLAAQNAGLDVEAANNAIELGLYEQQLQNNVFLAQSMGVRSTPFWIVGDRAITGAVGKAGLAQAIAQARDS